MQEIEDVAGHGVGEDCIRREMIGTFLQERAQRIGLSALQGLLQERQTPVHQSVQPVFLGVRLLVERPQSFAHPRRMVLAPRFHVRKMDGMRELVRDRSRAGREIDGPGASRVVAKTGRGAFPAHLLREVLHGVGHRCGTGLFSLPHLLHLFYINLTLRVCFSATMCS